MHKESTPHFPEISFSTFILSLASSALTHLGEVPHPDTNEKRVDLGIASHTIDVLDMLQDKVKNGITEEEQKLIDGILYELRMKYIALQENKGK